VTENPRDNPAAQASLGEKEANMKVHQAGLSLVALGLLTLILGLQQQVALASGLDCHGYVAVTASGSTQLHCEGMCPPEFPICVDIYNPGGPNGYTQCYCTNGPYGGMTFIGDQVCQTQTQTVWGIQQTQCVNYTCVGTCEIVAMTNLPEPEEPEDPYVAAWECQCQ
jgi:hypothetical protein